MKVLKIIFEIVATFGFIGMLGSDTPYDYWWVTLLISFCTFLFGVLGVIFIENRYTVYSWLYASIVVLGSFFYLFFKNNELTKYCHKLFRKCGNSYYNLFNIVKIVTLEVSNSFSVDNR